MNLLLLSLALLGCLATTVSAAYGPMKGNGCTWLGCWPGKRETAAEGAEQTDYPIGKCWCRSCFGGKCKKVDNCNLDYKRETVFPPIGHCSCTSCLKGYGCTYGLKECPAYGKKRDAAEEIVEKREAEVVEKREESEKLCGNIQECRCDERGCHYVNGCLIRKVDHCPPLFGKKREAAEEIVEKREAEVVEKREADGIVEKREDKVVEKRGPICLTITGCICKADGTCWYTERCDPPIKVGYCPQNGNKREAAEEIVEKREEVEKRKADEGVTENGEVEAVEKRETDVGVNENGEVEAVEKREASETRCKTTKPSCECTNGHGCFYTNGCLRRKVPHCPWSHDEAKKHDAFERIVEKREAVEKPAAKSCEKGCICSGFWIERCDYCEDCKCRKVPFCPSRSQLPIAPCKELSDRYGYSTPSTTVSLCRIGVPLRRFPILPIASHFVNLIKNGGE